MKRPDLDEFLPSIRTVKQLSNTVIRIHTLYDEEKKKRWWGRREKGIELSGVYTFDRVQVFDSSWYLKITSTTGVR